MIHAGLHNPTAAHVDYLPTGTAALKVVDGEGGEMVIFTDPATARAMAEAFNVSRPPETGTASPINGD